MQAILAAALTRLLFSNYLLKFQTMIFNTIKKIYILIIPVFFLIACGNNKREETVAATNKTNVVVLNTEQYKNAGIQTGPLSNQSIATTIKVNGKIDVPPQNIVSVSIPLGGYLKSSKLLPGMQIRKGEILAVVEDQQYIQLQQDYLTAKAEIAFNEAEYNRQKELNASKASSDKVYEQSKATYEKQYVLLKALEQKLQLIGINPEKVVPNNISKSINIYSPIHGFVSAVNINIGKYVNPADVMFELVNPADIHLALTVFEKDINRLSIGQKVIAYTNSNPEKKYPGTIILISKSLSSDHATELHCHFEKYDNSLLPGMFMNAEVEVSGTNTPALPQDAIVRFENKQYIFIVQPGNRFALHEVQTGSTENGFTEIINARELDSQTIVTKGAYNLLMALKNTSEE
ncbi:efflux RND transporter periplasmic adaptor subunit [Chitinophagaceae bacterium 26-R-25]|nr:efflux RND transporter periplasmic adaptor subunit [Chitinophagaceae bacterium 26-R-25]